LWYADKPAMQRLDTLLKQGPVTCIHHLTADMNAQIASNADQVLAKSTVMQLAQGNTVADACLTMIMRIRNDVRGIEPLRRRQSCHRTLVAVGVEDRLSKRRLV